MTTSIFGLGEIGGLPDDNAIRGKITMSDLYTDEAYREGSDHATRFNAEDSDEFGAIEAALSEASKKANAAWLSLVTTLLYLVIATVKITHKDLLLERPVKLPLLSVDMPLVYFSIIAPVLIFGAHVFTMLLVRGLRDKVDLWKELLSAQYRSKTDRKRLCDRLDTSLLAQAFGHDLDLRQIISYGAAWASIVAAPMLALVLQQIIFLPYQSPLVTDIQRVLLLFDCVAVVLLWALRYAWKAAYLVALMIFPVAPSWLILVFPDNPRSNLTMVDQIVERSPLLRKSARKWLAGSVDLVHHSASSWLTNRLVLPDQDIANELGKEGATPSLRGRRLSFAILDRSNLNGVDFTSADMRDASFFRAKLRAAKFECADIGEEELQMIVADNSSDETSTSGLADFGNIRCALLNGADFTEADLTETSLTGAVLLGALFDGADLDRSSLKGVQGEGASFSSSSMTFVDLQGATLDGANFNGSDLTASDFSNVMAPGANFDGAFLFGAKFGKSYFRHSSFRGTQLQGASIRDAFFGGARFVGVGTYRATPNLVQFQGAIVQNVDPSGRWEPNGDGLISKRPP